MVGPVVGHSEAEGMQISIELKNKLCHGAIINRDCSILEHLSLFHLVPVNQDGGVLWE